MKDYGPLHRAKQHIELYYYPLPPFYNPRRPSSSSSSSSSVELNPQSTPSSKPSTKSSPPTSSTLHRRRPSSKTMKECDDDCKRRRIIRRTIYSIVFFIILILLAILIVWLVLRPTKPQFYLQDARVLGFNLSAPNLLSSTIQITISSRNPNERVGVYYDRLDVYAAYKNQQITPAYSIPGLYQGHKDIDVWSPYLSGSYIPIAPYLCTSLTQDEANGFLFLYVKIDGRLRWKVGSWTSDHYHIFVNCPAFLTFDNRAAGPVIRFQQMSTCSVDV